ncbi:hypothetical protein F9K50_04045 [bacterium]|nr:MAG: hypothetical protein F9K50_04045 [bacterium]
MISDKDKALDSKVLEKLLCEESRTEADPKVATPATAPKATGAPQWQVEESKATPFVSDFFFSHSDKVLGI